MCNVHGGIAIMGAMPGHVLCADVAVECSSPQLTATGNVAREYSSLCLAQEA
jgi:hypothetical protein